MFFAIFLFRTQAEQDALDDIDPIAIRASLAERGILNGQVVDAQKLDDDPFIQRVMADAEQLAAEDETPEPRFSVTTTSDAFPDPEDAFAIWDQRIHNYYASGDGTVPTFPDEAAAQNYLNQLIHPALNSDLQEPEPVQPTYTAEPVTIYPGDKNNLPYDVVVERLHIEEPEPPTPEPEKTLDEVLDEHPISIQVNGEWQTFPNAAAAEDAAYEEYKANVRRNAQNFRITDDHLGEGGPKAKFQANINAIQLLKELEATGQQASPEQQQVLSRYVGWGGLPDAFDPSKESWSKEYARLKELLTPEEYAAARGSTLNAHYTSPTVIQAIYEAVGRMGFPVRAASSASRAAAISARFWAVPELATASSMTKSAMRWNERRALLRI